MAGVDLPILQAIGLTLVAYFILSYLQNYRTLKGIPGPLSSKFSMIPSVVNNLSGKRVYWIHELHKKYGKVIQVRKPCYTVSVARL